MVIAVLVLIILLAGFALGGQLGAPWVPAFRRDVEKILDDCHLKAGQLYIELGCGDGRGSAAAAKRGARAIGYEVNPLMWFIACLRCLRYPNAKIKLANFWGKPLSSADVVFTFLMPKFMPKLENKLSSELKPGASFVSYIYKLPNKKAAYKRPRWSIYEY